jgi:hypothetical protein
MLSASSQISPHEAIWPGAGPAFYPHDLKAFEIYWSTCGAGDGNRTRMTSLEGWSSTIELRPQQPPNHRLTPVAYRLPRHRRDSHARPATARGDPEVA